MIQKLKRPEVVVNRLPKTQHTFQKKYTVPGEKTYKEAVAKKTNTTHINNFAILGVLSVLTEISNPSLIRL